MTWAAYELAIIASMKAAKEASTASLAAAEAKKQAEAMIKAAKDAAAAAIEIHQQLTEALQAEMDKGDQ